MAATFFAHMQLQARSPDTNAAGGGEKKKSKKNLSHQVRLALGMGRDPAQTPIQPYLIK